MGLNAYLIHHPAVPDVAGTAQSLCLIRDNLPAHKRGAGCTSRPGIRSPRHRERLFVDLLLLLLDSDVTRFTEPKRLVRLTVQLYPHCQGRLAIYDSWRPRAMRMYPYAS